MRKLIMGLLTLTQFYRLIRIMHGVHMHIYDIENDYLSDKGILITKISPVEFSSQYINFIITCLITCK